MTHYRYANSDRLTPHCWKDVWSNMSKQFGRAPERVAADPGFFSGANESKAREMGVSRVSIPSHDTKSHARKQRQKQRWFKELQKWRTGCEGRIGVLKRRHGLRRSLYKGPDGIQRWVRLGVIADNVIHIGVPTWPSKHARAKCPLLTATFLPFLSSPETDFLTRLSSHPQTRSPSKIAPVRTIFPGQRRFRLRQLSEF